MLLPCTPLSSPCSLCAATPSLGHEDVYKGALRRTTARHDEVVKVFVRALSASKGLDVVREPRAAEGKAPPRADFSILCGSSRNYYDVQIVAVNKDSAREGAYATLTEAAEEKKRKYRALGRCFFPLIFSAGGLMQEDLGKAYKGLQKLLTTPNAAWLDSCIGVALTKARAISAVSIATNPLSR